MTGRQVERSEVTLGALAVAGYVSVVVAANVATSRYGMVPVLPGLAVPAGTYLAGLALGLRDAVQDRIGKVGALLAILAASAISFAFASPAIATASLAAFLTAELVDLVIYTSLRRRGWRRAVIASNVAGAILDTVVFLTVAGFGLTWMSVTGQLVGKILWATLLPVAVISGYQQWSARERGGTPSCT